MIPRRMRGRICDVFWLGNREEGVFVVVPGFRRGLSGATYSGDILGKEHKGDV